MGAVLEGLPGLLETRVDVAGGRVLVRFDPARTSVQAVTDRLDASAQYEVVASRLRRRSEPPAQAAPGTGAGSAAPPPSPQRRPTAPPP